MNLDNCRASLEDAGMSGTMNQTTLNHVFFAIKQIVNDSNIELIDIGHGFSHVLLFAVICGVCRTSKGIDFNEGANWSIMEMVYQATIHRLSKGYWLEILNGTIERKQGNICHYRSLQSCFSSWRSCRRVVYTFCTVFEVEAVTHICQLIAADPTVVVAVFVPHRKVSVQEMLGILNGFSKGAWQEWESPRRSFTMYASSEKHQTIILYRSVDH